MTISLLNNKNSTTPVPSHAFANPCNSLFIAVLARLAYDATIVREKLQVAEATSTREIYGKRKMARALDVVKKEHDHQLARSEPSLSLFYPFLRLSYFNLLLIGGSQWSISITSKKKH